MSGVYIGVDGKARKVKGGYIGIDGVARKIKKGYIGVDGVARLCWSSVDPVFANNTWEEIALACQTGNVPTSWEVGDQKTMTIDGTDYAIDIIGKNHDDYADGSGKAPLTFQVHEALIVANHDNMHTGTTNTNGWETCEMRNIHVPYIKTLFPTNVQYALRKVKKSTSSGNATTPTETIDDLFLLSEYEVFAYNKIAREDGGAQYEYYAEGGSGAEENTKAVKKDSSGNAVAWNLRSPTKGYPNQFCRVNSNGTRSTAVSSTSGYLTLLAFCF